MFGSRYRDLWAQASELMPDLVGPEYGAEVQALMNQESGHSPLTWAERLKEVSRKSAQTDGANDRYTRFLIRLVQLKVAFEERLHQDPDYFGSQRGQTLLALARAGYSGAPQEFHDTTFPLFPQVVGEPELQRLPMLAQAADEMQFEVWQREFCQSLLTLTERWYKVLLIHFVKVTGWARAGHCDPMPAELGPVMTRARAAWQSDPELLPMVDDRIRIFRNSVGHGHTEFDLAAERLTFKNVDRAGQVTSFEASKAELLELAKDIYQAADVMRFALLAAAYEPIKPEIFEKAGIRIAS